MEPSIVYFEDRFTRFIEDFTGDGNPRRKYELVLSGLAARNEMSLVVDFRDLYDFDCEFANELLVNPADVIPFMGLSAFSKLKIKSPEYADVIKKVHVRIRGLPDEVLLRNIADPEQIGKLIEVSGIVTQLAFPSPFLVQGCWACDKCGAEIILDQKDEFQKPPRDCPACNSRRGFTLVPKKSVFIQSQRITIQERPEKLPAGLLPKPFNLSLKEDLVEKVRPGDRVSATGEIDLLRKTKGSAILRTYGMVLDVNHIDVMSRNMELVEITKADEERILELSRDPQIFELIVDSIAPEIYGRRDIKQAIAYFLFGGIQKVLPGITIRDWLNVLLVGDPGTGKSQLLEFAHRVAPRSMIASGGKHASGVGLTASLIKVDGEFVIRPGALAICDLGYVMIDELDKFDEEERESLHRPMEQGDLPVVKGGLTAILNARTAILAAANPTLGRYNPYQTIAQNIDIPVTLLSRFDLIFVIRDIPEHESDEKLSRHLSSLHRGVNPQKPPIDMKTLTKYILYARRLNPVITEDLDDPIADFYVRTRTASVEGGEASAITISPRNQEALIRLAESRARMFLRDKVERSDIDAAIELMMISLEQVGIDPETGELDMDVLYSGQPRSLQMQLQKVLGVISNMQLHTGTVRDDDLFQALLEDHGLGRSETKRLIGVLMRDATIYSPRPGYYKKTG